MQAIWSGIASRFFGPLSGTALKAVYHACDVFCLPCHFEKDGLGEGFPVVLIEAMACGKPVISTRHVEIPNVIKRLLVDEKDVDGLKSENACCKFTSRLSCVANYRSKVVRRPSTTFRRPTSIRPPPSSNALLQARKVRRNHIRGSASAHDQHPRHLGFFITIRRRHSLSTGASWPLLQEERFTRKKHDAAFPLAAVDYCLQEAGLQPEDLDYVGFYDKPLTKFERLLETYLVYVPRGYRSFRRALPLWLKQKLHLPHEMRRGLRVLSRAARLHRSSRIAARSAILSIAI
ncbi:MAG: carbamoyltransferase N-terminal domain-containing protein [Pirellulaceae bacterium]